MARCTSTIPWPGNGGDSVVADHVVDVDGQATIEQGVLVFRARSNLIVKQFRLPYPERGGDKEIQWKDGRGTTGVGRRVGKLKVL